MYKRKQLLAIKERDSTRRVIKSCLCCSTCEGQSLYLAKLRLRASQFSKCYHSLTHAQASLFVKYIHVHICTYKPLPYMAYIF